ncbi:MAG: hypothetical protein FGM29_09580 [Actinobacteria bacterium]|nr:hypothetical protein [Actinomycetota bacterium]
MGATEGDDRRCTTVAIDPAGNLVIRGEDTGSTVRRFFGSSTYEWCYTIDRAQLPLVRELLTVPGDVELSTFIRETLAADVIDLLKSAEVPMRFSNWTSFD